MATEQGVAPLEHVRGAVILQRRRTPAEERLLDLLSRDGTAVLSHRDALDDTVDPGHGYEEATVDGAVLSAVLCGEADGALDLPQQVTIAGIRVVGAVDLRQRRIERAVRFENIRFEGGLDCLDAVLGLVSFVKCRLTRLSLERASARVVEVIEGTAVHGETTLNAATLGHLDMSDSTLCNPRKRALNANVLTTTRSARLVNLRCIGRATFIGVRIGGQLILNGAKFTHPGKEFALSIHEATIDRSAYLRGTTVTGGVNFSGAAVGGRLDARRATFSGRPSSIDLTATNVARAVQFTKATFRGRLSMAHIKVGSYLSVQDSTFIARNDVLIDLSGAVIGGELRFRPEKIGSGSVQLIHTRTAQLRDTHADWPEGLVPVLAGFEYDWMDVDGENWTLDDRIAWLGRDTDSGGQPYEQLAGLLRERGRNSDARTVLHARDVANRRQHKGAGAILETVALDWTIGYGYRLYRILWWLACVWLFGAGLWSVAWSAGALVDDDGGTARCPTDAQCFNEFAMSADVLLPIVELGQADAWNVSGGGALPMWPAWLYWGQTVAGWTLTTIVVAGYTRAVQRQ